MEHETGTPEGPDVLGQGPQAGRGGAAATGVRRTATVVTGVAIAVAAGGAAWAASGTDGESASPTPGSSASPEPGSTASPDSDSEGNGYGSRGHGPGGRGLHGGMHGGGLGGVLHGEAVVPEGEAYQEVAFQRGTVSAVSPTSLEVESEDGFSRTYVLDAETLVDGTRGDVSSLAEGDTVQVLADVAGATVTATRVHEHDASDAGPGAGEDQGERRGRWGGHGPRGDAEDGDGSTDGSTEGSSSALTGSGTVVQA